MLLRATNFVLLRSVSNNFASKITNGSLLGLVIRCTSNGRGYNLLNNVNCITKGCEKRIKLLDCTTVSSCNFSVDTAYSDNLSRAKFEKISDETLESLTEYFDELIEQASHLPEADVTFGDGVLTVKFGEPYGTYVINRQTPNRQIWLSSPTSGPKRYDFINDKWIYKHDGKSMHELLNNEISVIVKHNVCFDKCSYSGKEQ